MEGSTNDLSPQNSFFMPRHFHPHVQQEVLHLVRIWLVGFVGVYDNGFYEYLTYILLEFKSLSFSSSLFCWSCFVSSLSEDSLSKLLSVLLWLSPLSTLSLMVKGVILDFVHLDAPSPDGVLCLDFKTSLGLLAFSVFNFESGVPKCKRKVQQEINRQDDYWFESRINVMIKPCDTLGHFRVNVYIYRYAIDW